MTSSVPKGAARIPAAVSPPPTKARRRSSCSPPSPNHRAPPPNRPPPRRAGGGLTAQEPDCLCDLHGRCAGIRDDDIEVFRHDVRFSGKGAYEINVLSELYPQELCLLLLHLSLKEREVGADIHLARIDEDLEGKIERVEESLKARNDGALLVDAFEAKID